MEKRRFSFIKILLVSVVMGLPFVSQAKLSTNIPIERITETSSVEADGHSSSVAVSRDGRYVVFESNASNLASSDMNGLRDIILYDSQADTFELISVDSAEVQANSVSFAPSVSSDGRYVAFHSLATNLVTGDNNGVADIFVRDRTAGTTIRVSVDGTGTESNGQSLYPSISNNGNLVVFISEATNLVAGDTNSNYDVFLRDISAGTTTRVSVDSSGTQSDDDSLEARISGDGTVIAFSSRATNLVSSDTNESSDVFSHVVSSGVTALESKDTSGTFGNSSSWEPEISDDGRYVVYTSQSNNLITGDTNEYRDIFLRDRQNSTTSLVSKKNDGAQFKRASGQPTVSDDGRYIGFVNNFPDENSSDTNKALDVFVHDRTSLSTHLISQSSANVVGDKKTLAPFFYPDGSKIAFESSATNLVSGDTNALPDIFVKDNPLALPIVQITPVASSLDEETASTMSFTLKRFNDLDQALTVNFSTGGTTTSGSDYTNPGTSVVFNAFDDTETLDITLTNDDEVENTENISVTLDSSANYVFGAQSTASTDITDTDKFEITISSTSVDMNEENEESGTITISRSGGTLGDLQVNYTTTGDAVSGTDYTTLSGQATIPDGQSTVDVTVSPIDDGLNEGDELFTLNLSSSSNYDLGTPASGNLTLRDNDLAKIKVIATDSRALEAATVETGEFRIERELATSDSIDVKYLLKGTAINGVDYTSLSGTATILANDSFVTVTVTPIDDSVIESSETVILEILPSDDYTIDSIRQATVIIDDDEERPVVSITATDDEGDESGDTIAFEISRTGSTASSMTINLTVAGSAKSGSDFQAITLPVSIPSGLATTTVTVTPLDDGLSEESESVILALQASNDYFIDSENSRAEGVILDDDAQAVSIFTKVGFVSEDSSEEEGIFLVERLGDISNQLTVDIEVSGSATEGSDYSAIGTTVVIAVGESSKEIKVDPLADSVNREGTESVTVEIKSSANYQLGSQIESSLSIGDATARVKSGSNEINDHVKNVNQAGDLVVFSSKATNIVSEINDSFENVFAYSLSNGQFTKLPGENGMTPNADTLSPQISSDSSKIVYTSKATNLVSGEVFDDISEIYVYDVAQSKNSRLLGFLSQRPDADCLNPSVSKDGRYVAFSSSATNLVASDTNGKSDVFVVDTILESIERVSLHDGTNQMLGDSTENYISDDGNHISFTSKSDFDGSEIENDQVFVFNRANSSTTMVTRVNAMPGDGKSFNPKISRNGKYVLFSSEAENLSLAGRNRRKDVFVYKMDSQSLEVASLSENGLSLNGDSFGASISADGRYVSFVSDASNFENDSGNCVTRPVIKDRILNRVLPLASESEDCRAGASNTFLASDAESLFVESKSSKILGGDLNGKQDIFMFSNPLKTATESFLLLRQILLNWM